MHRICCKRKIFQQLGVANEIACRTEGSKTLAFWTSKYNRYKRIYATHEFMCASWSVTSSSSCRSSELEPYTDLEPTKS